MYTNITEWLEIMIEDDDMPMKFRIPDFEKCLNKHGSTPAMYWIEKRDTPIP